jgi:cell division septation protein DedD
MRGAFDDREQEPARPRRDTELTLSSMTLLGIFFGLVLLCGLCFGLGYSLGRRNVSPPPASQQQEAGTQSPVQALGSHGKPSASAAPQAQQPLADATVPATGADTGPTQPSGAPPSSNPTTTGQAIPPPAQNQVRPAIGTTIGATPATAASTGGTLMVQVAAVSNQEDADVLTNALRRRGYPVGERRDPGDGMVHVRVGPFNTRDDAEKWRMKLLNDGYNAILQP